MQKNIIATLIFFLISFSSLSKEFITKWSVSEVGGVIYIPTGGGENRSDYDFTIDWGDGTVETIVGDDPDPSHEYQSIGDKIIKISGVFPYFYAFNDVGETLNSLNLLSIEQWGNIKWEDFSLSFWGARNMVINATDAPDLDNVTSLLAMFGYAKKMNSDLNHWDVSNIVEMGDLFLNATSFNGDIGEWNTSNVTDMSDMFNSATSFNQSIGSWDVSNVTNMKNMFKNSSFNQGLENWVVSNVKNMSGMFTTASFNQNISAWDVSSVEEMESLFSESDFNQDISNWDVSSVWNMNSVFLGTSFNHDISSWDVSNVEDMTFMFLLNMEFNQNISSWDVSNVRYMWAMFAWAFSFDQDISAWDVSSCEDMTRMFGDAISFNQNLGAWNVISLENASDMFGGIGLSLSRSNYDSLLLGWSNLPQLKQGVELGVRQYYCLADEAREKLMEDFGWKISDKGESCKAKDYSVDILATEVNEENEKDIVINVQSNYLEDLRYKYSFKDINDAFIRKEGLLRKGDSLIGSIDLSSLANGEISLEFQLGYPDLFNLGEPVFDRVIKLTPLSVKNLEIIHIYPNPTSGYLFFSRELNIKSAVIYSSSGALVLKKVNENTIEKLDISSLNPGTYLLMMYVDGSTVNVKIVKQ